MRAERYSSGLRLQPLQGVDAKRHAKVSLVKELDGLKIATPRRGSDGELIIRAILDDEGMCAGTDVQRVQIDGF